MADTQATQQADKAAQPQGRAPESAKEADAPKAQPPSAITSRGSRPNSTRRSAAS